jgi:glycosyltransferase involved in cell wall biosynthesis
VSLSIIIPAFNAAAHIAATLDSLQILRSRGAEIVVVDGGSSDDTVALAREHADQMISAVRGNAQQMNAGAAAARGEILCFLQTNARLPEGADGLMIGGLARSRRSWGCFKVRSASAHPLRRMAAVLMNCRAQLTGIASGAQGIFVTRSLFEAAGRFPESARREDLAFTRQLKIYGAPLHINHPLTITYRSEKTADDTALRF